MWVGHGQLRLRTDGRAGDRMLKGASMDCPESTLWSMVAGFARTGPGDDDEDEDVDERDRGNIDPDDDEGYDDQDDDDDEEEPLRCAAG
jgi:hypothetical protein